MSGKLLRHCLIISPHFPPSNLAGVHRARHLAKYLPSHGWDPTVICVDPKQHVERLDPELARLVPETVKIVAAGALPLMLTRPFGLAGDIGLRGIFHLRAAIIHSINERRPDAIFITGSPFYPMLLASYFRRHWNIPVVLDFQDPWVSHEGASRKRWTKGWLSHRLAVVLEPLALRSASWITSVSERQNLEMAVRYPWLDRLRMSAIPIGGDPDDFVALANVGAPNRNTRFVFTYVGAAPSRFAPLLGILVQGIANLRRRRPALAERITFRFVGTSSQPGTTGDFRVLPIAEAAGVADLISEEPGRVPYLDALRIMASTDAAIMIGSDEPHYTASKIYPCLMAGRPFLSLFHLDSSAHRILSDVNGGVPLAYSPNVETHTLERDVADAIERIVLLPLSLGSINPLAFVEYTAEAVARKFADVLDRAKA